MTSKPVPYYRDSTVTLVHGDALAVLGSMADQQVDCVVTSPPYFALRNYGVPPSDWPALSYVPMAGLPAVDIPAMSCPLGGEPTPQAYIGHLVLIFMQAHRVLTEDGTLWLNMGDSYSSRADASTGPTAGRARPNGMAEKVNTTSYVRRKNLLGTPWQLAFALQAQGWILRRDVIWHKPNGMPESVNDRPAARHEYMFLLTKSENYWFDLDPIREEAAAPRGAARTWTERKGTGAPLRRGAEPEHARGDSGFTASARGRNPGDVWTIPTQPFPAAHFAVMAPSLAQRCVLSGCKPGGTVLDPFNGSGTTGLACQRTGRNYLGIDLKRTYLDLSLKIRLRDAALDFQAGA